MRGAGMAAHQTDSVSAHPPDHLSKTVEFLNGRSLCQGGEIAALRAKRLEQWAIPGLGGSIRSVRWTH